MECLHEEAGPRNHREAERAAGQEDGPDGLRGGGAPSGKLMVVQQARVGNAGGRSRSASK